VVEDVTNRLIGKKRTVSTLIPRTPTNWVVWALLLLSGVVGWSVWHAVHGRRGNIIIVLVSFFHGARTDTRFSYQIPFCSSWYHFNTTVLDALSIVFIFIFTMVLEDGGVMADNKRRKLFWTAPLPISRRKPIRLRPKTGMAG